MNLGIEHAKGEFIGIVEPDDFIDNTMYEKLYEYSQRNPKIDIVKSNFYQFNNEYHKKTNKFLNTNGIYKNIKIPEFIQSGHPSIWSAIYKRTFLKTNQIYFSKTPGAAFQDVGFNIKTWLLADRIAITNNAFYHYRLANPNSSVNKGHKMAFVTLNEYKLLYKWLKSHEISNEIYEIINTKTFEAFKYNYKTRLKRNRLYYILQCHKILGKQYKKGRIAKNKFSKSDYKTLKMISKHPYFYYLKSLFITKVKNTNQKQFYLFRIPFLSIYNMEDCKIYKFFGIKFRIKKENIFQRNTQNNDFLFNLYQDKAIEKNINKKINYQEDIVNLLQTIKNTPTYLWVDSNHNYLNILLEKNNFTFDPNDNIIDNLYLCWEIRPLKENLGIISKALNLNKKVIFAGDSFLRSINTFADSKALPHFQKGISFTFDDLTCYFDATRPSRLEQMLNDKTFILNEEQLNRAKLCINKIIDNHLTKYNSQPIFTPNIGRPGVKKVLVVDQSYGDMSIEKGLANDTTFKEMLQSAISENPDADIIIKTHPDTIAGRGGYYKGYKAHDNIYTQTEPINPISLINYCDKVYVCTTQFGFEALMCNKEVHVFGMPFYAGWGLTHDRQKCERRTNTRTLEEIFYITYIVYSFYVNPKTNSKCEIEEAIDYLISLRDEYFSKQN